MVLLYKIKNERHFFLKADNIHTIYVEESGNPHGIPLITLHGGPGIPMSRGYQKLFNGNVYRIISFHQRGCGLSTPRNELQNNNTKFLMKDMELIRNVLGIKKWLVEGISWGATLAVIYGINHPDKCLGIVIGGLSLMSDSTEKSTQACAPDIYDKWVGKNPKKSMDQYMKDLQSQDCVIRNKATKMWNVEEKLFELMDFENHGVKRRKKAFNLMPDDDNTLALMECYYYKNLGFVPKGYILKNAYKLKGIEGYIIHGRYDIICACENAYKLSKVWPGSKLMISEMAGHSFRNINNLINWNNAFKNFEKLYPKKQNFYVETKFIPTYEVGSFKIKRKDY